MRLVDDCIPHDWDKLKKKKKPPLKEITKENRTRIRIRRIMITRRRRRRSKRRRKSETERETDRQTDRQTVRDKEKLF